MNGFNAAKTGPDLPAVSILLHGPADAGLFARLHGTAFSRPWSETTFRHLLTEAGTLGLTATIPGDQEPAGFAVFRQLEDEAEILTLAVSPTCRRRGCGRALGNGIWELASAFGCERIILEVAGDNLAARKLYDRLGYKPVGRRRGYYRRNVGPAIDALILSCDLGHAGDDFI